MARSEVEFSRWKPTMSETWAYKVFKKHDSELMRMIYAFNGGKRFIYSSLKKEGASLEEKASKYLKFGVPKGEEIFEDLKNWSDELERFYNWMNLNTLLAATANFETYLATVVTLALESNPGILYKSPKSIDGIVILKKGGKSNAFIENIVTSLTKGDWNSRISSFDRVFGEVPPKLKDNISDLEKIRKLRNKLGHAFGRDIEESRNHKINSIQKIEKLKVETLIKYQKLIREIIKSIDEYMLFNHIGQYQILDFYHTLYQSLDYKIHPNERARILKKKMGAANNNAYGTEVCRGTVEYYEKI